MVSNREPALDEIGYRPRNGTIPQFNPPSLAWLHEKGAHTYTLQWANTSDFTDPVTVTNLPFNCYTHNRPLQPGDYFWRYRFATTNEELSDWSLDRKFTLNKSAIEFAMPSREERRTLIPAGHPRLFLRPEDLPRLRQLAKGPEAKRFAELRKVANELLKKEPLAEPTEMGSSRNKRDLAAIQHWWPNRERALAACMEAETMAFVYLMTGVQRYGEEARKRVMHLVSWNPDGPTNFKINCEAAKPMLHRISRAYDWAYDRFTADERRTIQQLMLRRIKDAWESSEVGRGVGHLNRPLSSHGNRTWHKIGESGIAFLDEIPEAETWLDYALNKFYTCYPTWSDEDGGWHEGAAYFGGYMSKAVWWLEVARSALKIDGFKKPFFSQVGDFPLYLAPPGSPNVGFGDLSYRNSTSGWGGFMEYFIRRASANPDSEAGYWHWWWKECGMKPESGVLGFLYHANLPPMPAPKMPTNLPISKIFRGTGLASLHTSLLNSSNDVHFLFKSDPFGSQSHGHNPQNSFQLNAYGDALLTACVYRDLHGSEFHEQWAHQTVSQNAVLVNGRGQLPHSAKSRGRILDFELTRKWDYVVGDAVETYEGRLDRYHRHVLFLKPGFILLYDDLVAAEPSQFQFMLHALSPFALNRKNGSWHVQQPNAGVSVQYLSTDSLTSRQWDGLEPKSIRGTFPNQWHLEVATTKPREEVGMLTLLAPHWGKQSPKMEAERIETATAIGCQVKINGKDTLLGFRKFGVKGEAELAGVRFDKGVIVK